ncbi:MAG: hypothetical protein Q7S55_01260 [Nanoarchaeota archaeon]|nr:hypothetical protein [Nanoarchaeota archaeon]
MLISFFEEFPTEESLAKLKLVSWPTKLYIAANSVDQFRAVTSVIRHNQNLLEAIYWPILKKREGYWISPFSKQTALQRLFDELEHKKIPVMLDLELPTTQNPWLYLTQFINFKKDKKLIHSFVCNHPGETYLCEYAASEKNLQRLGLHFTSKKSKIMKMLYHSVHYYSGEKLKAELQQGIEEYGDRYVVGYGTIAIGVNGNEPILSAEQLEKDLQIAQEVGVKEVVLFRLGGLNKRYVKVMEKFV